jgi:membrane protein
VFDWGNMTGYAQDRAEPQGSRIPECTNVAELKRRATESHDHRTAAQGLQHSARWLWRNPKAFVGILKSALEGWSQHNISRLSAALAYYAVFSLAPVLIISISIAGLVFGKDAAQHAIGQEIQSLIGQDTGSAVLAMIQSARKPKATSLVAILGLATLLFSASGAFVEIQDALNAIWEVKAKPRDTVLQFIRKRFVSFGMVLSTGFLLLVSLVVSATLTALGRWGSALSVPTPIFHLVDGLLSFIVITAIFALLYKIVPDARTAWSDVWPAAATTALLFTVGKFFIGFYVTKSLTASAYGAAASVVIVLAWVYYSAQILYSGAEIVRACEHHRTLTQASSPEEEVALNQSQDMPGSSRRAQHATP